MLRKDYPVKIRHLHDPEPPSEYLQMTPVERINLVWPLTLDAWAFKEGKRIEPRLQRHIVRVVRRGS
jgi:hypothetical protein